MINSVAHEQRYRLYNPYDGAMITLDGVTMTVKVTGAETDGAFAVIESTASPHFAGGAAQIHRRTRVAFYVVHGALAFTLAEETVMIRQGGLLTVAPGLLYKFWNPTATPATYLTYFSPAGGEQYFVELAALMLDEPAWPPADPRKLRALAAKYDRFATGEPF